MRKKTNEDFQNFLDEKWPGKYERIGEYTGNKNRVMIKHIPCGTCFEARPNTMVSGSLWEQCPTCTKIKKSEKYVLPFEEVKNRISSVWGNEVDIVGEYKNASEKMSILFNSCGHICNMTLYSLLSLKQCPVCNGRYLFSHDEFVGKIEKLYPNKYTILENYTGTKNKILVKYNECQCERKVLPSHLLHGRGCKKHCAIKTHKEYSEGIEEKYPGQFILLEKYIIGYENIRIFHTICENESIVNAQGLFNEGSCPMCKKSVGANKIYRLLLNLGVKFKDEKSFEDCVSIIKLRFDFCVFHPTLEKLCLIEFHGGQHYAPHDFSGRMTKEELDLFFKGIQERDKIKEKYCQDNNIPLLIIPYWKINYLEKMIIQFLIENNILKEGYNGMES